MHDDPARVAWRKSCSHSEARTLGAGFRVSGDRHSVIYVPYLDEFGHLGPYVGRSGPRHNTSPVFGFAGYIMPAEAVRGFGTWFFQRKGELFARPMAQSPKHPAT